MLPAALASGDPGGAVDGMKISSRLPLMPSMMVMVLVPGGGAALAGAAPAGAAFAVCAAGGLAASSGLAPRTTVKSAGATAHGSPPNGSSTIIAHPARMTTNRLRTPTTACGMTRGSVSRRLGALP
jgi:hypothetical protein